MVVLVSLTVTAVHKNALEPQDKAECQKRYDPLTERFNIAKKNLADTEAEINRKELARSAIRQFLDLVLFVFRLSMFFCSYSMQSDKFLSALITI